MSRVTMSRAPMIMGRVVTSARDLISAALNSHGLLAVIPVVYPLFAVVRSFGREARGDQPTGLRDSAEKSLLQEMRSRILGYRFHCVKSGASLSNVAATSSSISVVMLTLSCPRWSTVRSSCLHKLYCKTQYFGERNRKNRFLPRPVGGSIQSQIRPYAARLPNVSPRRASSPPQRSTLGVGRSCTIISFP